MNRPCRDECPLSDALIVEVARLTGVTEDVVRIAHGLPVATAHTPPPRRVVLELPHGADAGYERAAFLDSVARGEAPISASALHTVDAAAASPAADPRVHEVWGMFAEATVVYADLGISTGMQRAIDLARLSGRDVEVRRLGVPWAAEPRRRTSMRVSSLGAARSA